jgi:arabinan endo-1,5-alpha-L-arabinosidase
VSGGRKALACLAITAALGACGGGGRGGGGPGVSAGGPDFGTASTLDDSFALRIKNVASGLSLTIESQSQLAGAQLDQTVEGEGVDQTWHVMPMGGSSYNIENLLTHQVVGIANAATSVGSRVVQYADSGSSDHVWTFYRLTDGNYLIKNANSGLYLQSDTSAASTLVDQGARTGSSGCKCQEWSISSLSTAAYPAPQALVGAGVNVHDPNMIQAPDGSYWLYGTHNTLAHSIDGLDFGAVTHGDISPDFPWWASKNTTAPGGRTDIWAPSVMFANGTYFQYYSIPIYDTPSTVGTNQGAEAVIALATANSPAGPWIDAGQIIASCGKENGCATTYNAIDPAPFVDADGSWWLSFGSWEDGIHILQLDPTTGLRLASDRSLSNVASRPNVGEEGSFVLPWAINGTAYYFLFASINVCCSGTASTYRIVVGRSTLPTGPFVDRGGVDMMNGGGTILLSSHANIFGPGGQSVLTVSGRPLLVYHYYDGSSAGAPKLGLNYLGFDQDGWPSVE